MPGVPTQLIAADLVFSGLGGAIAAADRPHFDLGAIMLSMMDFLPSRPEMTGNAPMLGVWTPILTAIADTPAGPGILTNLTHAQDVLARARKIVEDAKANFITSLEAKAKLLGMMDEIIDLATIATTIKGQMATFAGIPAATMTSVAAARPAHKSTPNPSWLARDLFHGSRTGRFFEVLRRKAKESGNRKLIAFVDGVAVSYGVALAGNAFANGVVGAPYRNHFWRHRWIGHRIDTWVHGYYRSQAQLAASGQAIAFTPSSRVPMPQLKTWASVCGANLQKRFEFGGITPIVVINSVAGGTAIPSFLPNDVVTLWIDSMNEAHPGGVGAGFDAMGLQGAYALTWLTTWLQTSPDFLGDVPPDQINWPDGCGPRPSWAAPDGSILVGGASMSPPTPALGDPSKPKLASAIALALLALADFLLGNIAGGIAALGAALALLDAGTPPNWDQLGCDLAWTDCYIISLRNAFRSLLVAAGLAPPYPVELTHSEPYFVVTQPVTPDNPAVIPPDAALNTCRSPAFMESSKANPVTGYPHAEWNPVLSNWTQYPTNALETPSTTDWPAPTLWPNAFLDGISTTQNATPPPAFTRTLITPTEIDPLSGKPTLFDKDEWERRMMRAEAGGDPGFRPFGNAVGLALLIIGSKPDSLLDWDLGSDRGIGWPTWVWPNATATSGNVERE